MKKTFLTLVLISLSVGASAQPQSASAGVVTGYIASERNSKELFVFQTEGAPVGGCNTTGRFAVDSDSKLFKGTQAAVMAAYHSKTVIRVYYENTCNALGNAADLSWTCVGTVPC